MPLGLYKFVYLQGISDMPFVFLAESAQIEQLKAHKGSPKYCVEISKHDYAYLDPRGFRLVTEDQAFCAQFKALRLETFPAMVDDVFEAYRDNGDPVEGDPLAPESLESEEEEEEEGGAGAEPDAKRPKTG
jgi:hypothetical protein